MTALAPEWKLPATELYPERADRKEHWLDRIETALTWLPIEIGERFDRFRVRRMAAMVNGLEDELRALGDDALQARCREFHAALRIDGLTAPRVVSAFAVIREVSRRTTGLRHYDVQILGGLAILYGSIAEMDTGEGKTVTAALAAGTAALAGIPVHVITVNDYLASRDAEFLAPIYRFLGLSVGTITDDLSKQERAAVYAQDIVYTSNKAIAFDYLRDRIALGNRVRNVKLKLDRLQGVGGATGATVMRGLHFAIVDEADSVLVDEARTPLIISHETDVEEERKLADQAFEIVEGLEAGLDYKVLAAERRVELTDKGRSRLRERAEAMGGLWTNRIRREETARQALSALLLFKNGDQYLVRDGKVQIVDEYTGRIMAERSWSDGLHQLVEAKEGCEITSRKLPVARITYQRFFRRYLRLAGMTGTAREVSGELWSVYRLTVTRVEPNLPPRRMTWPPVICADAEAKWARIVERARGVSALRRPVLIGTRSVIASTTLSEHLSRAGLEHTVLNAEQSAHEAEIIARAGEPGRITVATNMAGRGVDILLGPGVADLGGLHVILSERHDAGRIDRQLEGRTARRGEPGSTEAILSLEDPLLDLVPAVLVRLFRQYEGFAREVFGGMLYRYAQRRAERSHSRARRILLTQDRRLGVMLAFSGRGE